MRAQQRIGSDHPSPSVGRERGARGHMRRAGRYRRGRRAADIGGAQRDAELSTRPEIYGRPMSRHHGGRRRRFPVRLREVCRQQFEDATRKWHADDGLDQQAVGNHDKISLRPICKLCTGLLTNWRSLRLFRKSIFNFQF